MSIVKSVYVTNAADAATATVEARKQTPTGNALNVQIGSGDIISNIPVVMDFLNHQIHEGEVHHALYNGVGIGAATVKFGITVSTYNPTVSSPHLTLDAEVYNGSVLVLLYETATFTGGSLITKYNKNRNSNITDATTITSGVTSTDGTLIDAFYAGAGSKSGGGGGIRDEWILKSNTIYRVDLIGQAAGTDCYLNFEYYADLGV
jgi:hypothetical protein